jgi:hypothetical protein
MAIFEQATMPGNGPFMRHQPSRPDVTSVAPTIPSDGIWQTPWPMIGSDVSCDSWEVKYLLQVSHSAATVSASVGVAMFHNPSTGRAIKAPMLAPSSRLRRESPRSQTNDSGGGNFYSRCSLQTLLYRHILVTSQSALSGKSSPGTFRS